MAGSDKGRLPALDSLRGVAALLVVTFHCWKLGLYTPSAGLPAFLWSWTPLNLAVTGRPPVILFFVLSGFVLACSLERPGSGAGRFLLRRICRVYLPFVASLALSVAAYHLTRPHEIGELSSWFNHLAWTDRPSTGLVFKHLLMLGVNGSDSLNPVMWSLVFELRISLIFPLLFLVTRKWPGCALAASFALHVAAAVAIGCRSLDCAPFRGGDVLQSFVITGYFVIFFVAGIVLAQYRGRIRARLQSSPPAAVAALGGIGIYAMILPNTDPAYRVRSGRSRFRHRGRDPDRPRGRQPGMGPRFEPREPDLSGSHLIQPVPNPQHRSAGRGASAVGTGERSRADSADPCHVPPHGGYILPAGRIPGHAARPTPDAAVPDGPAVRRPEPARGRKSDPLIRGGRFRLWLVSAGPPKRRVMTNSGPALALAALLLACPVLAQPRENALPVPPVSPRIAEGEDYEHCLRLLSTDPAGANAYADAWQATGGGDGALHCQALAQIELGHAQTGADMLEKLAAASRAPSLARAAVYGQAVQAWLMAGDAAQAYGDATLALSLSPDDPDLLIDRSIAAATMERYMDAIDDLTRALALAPNRADALVFRAAAWRKEGRLDRAQEDIDRAVALDPDNSDALLERGIVRERRGNLAGARTDWERTIALAPEAPAAALARQNLASLEAGPAPR